MARRIAAERGWTLGREVGWHIRFERQFARDTRLLVVTEGILTAYLQDDPLLSDVATLIVDEFHERSIHADLGLALAKQAWTARQDLRIVVMSATLETGPVAAFLDGGPVISVPGTLHPLSVEYAPGESVAQAVSARLPNTTGNILCFLPGAGEIAAAIRETEPAARLHGVDLVALHGSLDAREQDAALRPEGPRRVIMATNVAETSLTVPGVSVVIDTGLQRVARYDADRGVDSLTLERVTLDSADQRAGRAARLGPGTARRLWDARDRLRPHREAEIHRVDLSGPLLAILAWGPSTSLRAGAGTAGFEWFDRPSDDRIEAALHLLARLGAGVDGRITDLGRQMRRMPLPPRLARVLVAARGSFEGCAACAWLAEPTRLEPRTATTPSDVLAVLDAWPRMPGHLKRAADALDRAASAALGEARATRITEADLRRALLAGYPDRVAKRRGPGKVTLATGHGAIVGRDSGVHEGDWLIALDVTAGRTGATTEAIIRMASRIEPEWLEPTRQETQHELDADSGTVKAREIDWYEALVLREHPIAPDAGVRAALFADAWMARAPDPDSQRLLRRIAFAGLDVTVRDLVALAAGGARRLADLVLTEDHLPWAMRRQLSQHAPERLSVPSGREMSLAYEDDGSVAMSVKLQELFGLGDTPVLGPRRVPVTVHLLAPNGRPVQTTRDLKSFWERTYPEVRKELRGRYPKHPWPEDPWNATPTHRTNRRA
jgi:ATP-dependent helicase HrpB